MPRYENATHFWQIERAGAANTITTGKHGNKGRTATKHHASIAVAHAQHDELVRDKLREGFTLVDVAPVPVPSSVDGALLEELQERLVDEPYDIAAYTVLGDLLQRDGDPRGELIALQLASDGTPADERVHLAPGKHVARHAEALLGDLARHVPDVRVIDAAPFRWRFGFIHRAELADGQLAILDELLAHPSGQLLAELAIMADAANATRTIETLVRLAPPALRELSLLVRGPVVATPLWPALPRLERLSIMARTIEVGAIAIPAARRLSLHAVLPNTEEVERIARAPWPLLERIDLRLGSSRVSSDAPAFEDIAPLLRRADLPQLSQVKLRGAPYAGAILRALAASPLASQLELIDLSFGDISPADTAALVTAAQAGKFGKLRELWLPMRHLRPQDRAALAPLAKHVIGDERSPRDRIEELVGRL